MSTAPTPSSPPVTAPASPLQRAPSLRRRLAALVYEGVLLFGVIFMTALVYSVLTNQRHGMEGRYGLGAALFAILALYFVWFWSRSGQTLALQTWHLRVVTLEGALPSRSRALARFLASWVWVLPPTLAIWALGWVNRGGLAAAAFVVWMLVYASLSWLHPRRQFWHDALCGTQLVETPRPASRGARRS